MLQEVLRAYLTTFLKVWSPTKATIIVTTKKINILTLAICLLAFMCAGQKAHAQLLGTSFPSSFRGTKTNEIEGEAHLALFFQKVKRGQNVKVMQIGDSHVRGNILPHTIQNTLQKYFPRLTFAYYGINGAWAKRFNEQDMINRVAAERPDLVIVSFGTNEAHGANLNETVHAQTMLTLMKRIRERCPKAQFLFTTPPGSFISHRSPTGRRGRHTTYSTSRVPNANTGRVARSIVSFCKANKAASWDLYSIAGGDSYAANNWRNAGLMNTDAIHFLASGYTLQGKLLGEALYKAYSQTALPGSQTRMMHEPTPKEKKPYKSLQGF